MIAHLEKQHESSKNYARAKLEEIYISKSFRKECVGKKILKEFYKWAKEKKVKSVRVYTKTKDTSAVSFWKKNKFFME